MINDIWDIADYVIEQAYPDIYSKGRGWWGTKRIPNWGILRGAIAAALLDERKNRRKHRRKNADI